MLLTILLLLHILFALGLGAGFLFLNERSLPHFERLPRAKAPGCILGFLALLGFLPNVEPMFPMADNLYWLIPCAILLTIACTLYIDYLFARALAGALIVAAHASLAESYAEALSGGSIFAVFTFIIGLFGIVIAAKPGLLRDLFRKGAEKPVLRLGIFIYCILWSLSALFLLIQYGGKKA